MKSNITRRSVLHSAGALWLLPPGPSFAVPPASSNEPFVALVKLGMVSAGYGNHRWAPVQRGQVRAKDRIRDVASGRLDWHVDPASGAIEANFACDMAIDSGATVSLRKVGLSATRQEDGFVLLREFDHG